MHQEQLSQVAKLPNGNVRAARCLQTFHTTYPNTDVGSLDHGNIVSTIANSEKERFEMPLNEFDDESFLEGRDSTATQSVSKSVK